MLVIALTGGIASGKSSVSARFEALGVPVIDADGVAREVVAPGKPGLAAVAARFGAEYLTAAGELDRPRLRRLIFADPDARHALETILHPLIRAGIRARIQGLLATPSAPYAILSIPLFVETGGQYPADRVLVVDAPESQQIARLCARDGVTEAEARRALAAQCDRGARLALADDVIDNSGDAAGIEGQVNALHRRYLAIARSR